MSICITGDTHGGFQRLSADNFPQQRQMGRDDFAVVTGDFGGVWDDSSGEALLAQLAGQKAVYDPLCGWKPRKHC